MNFFVDTNFFLHYKKYDQLKWSDITDEKDITIIISRPVQIQIDRLKNDGTSRRSKRARETTSFFLEMLNVENMTLHFNASNYYVSFKFAKQYTDALLVQSNPSLDMSNDDDKILAIMNNHIQEGLINISACVFLTNDTNPLLTAKMNNLPAIKIPDTWLLEPENDDKDKEIIKLKRQLLEIQNKEPRIEFEFCTNEYIQATDKSNTYKVDVKAYNQVDQSDIDRLVASLIKKHPQKTDINTDVNKFSGSLSKLAFAMHAYCPPTTEDIEEYNNAYQKWRSDIYDLFSCYANQRNKYSHYFPFGLIVSNNGNLPADNLLLSFEVLAGGKLVSPDFDEEVLMERWAYPTPPNPPTVKLNDSLSATLEFAARNKNAFSETYKNLFPLGVPKPLSSLTSYTRDKNSFYWKDGKPDKNCLIWYFECDEFRHKLKGIDFFYFLVFDENCDKIVLQIKASSSNMSSLLSETYILYKNEVSIRTKDDILYLIENGVTEAVMQRIEGKKNN